MIIKGNKGNFQEEVLSSKGIVLMDFYATWCGPCKALSPILEEVDKKYDGKVKIVKVNVDEEESLATRYGIASIPTVIFFKDGKTVATFVGLRGLAEISKIIDKHL